MILPTVLMLTSAKLELQLVTYMLCVLTTLDHIGVSVLQDILEMDTHVQVRKM